ncbi:hypothetical protein V7S43_010427 [Phytophthora oleae]|uniref:Crinkler effector protein N-terminal domain-containing protein n=1 Tax=Phytophthora oleae TaxID=2107226 RepID=A0ABD3FD82_9STRA
MKSAACAVVGAGRQVSVSIDCKATAAQLKESIKETYPMLIECEELTLFLAKKDNNWLKGNDPDFVKLLTQGEFTKSIQDIVKKDGNKLLQESDCLDSFNFPVMFPGEAVTPRARGSTWYNESRTHIRPKRTEFYSQKKMVQAQ